MIKSILSYTLCIGLSFCMCTAKAQKAVQQKFQVPVLKGRDINPILRLVVHVEDSGTPQFLNAAALSCSNPELVAQFNIMSTGPDSSLMNQEKLEKAVVFAHAGPNQKGKSLLKGNIKLNTGNNYFWLSVKVKPEASLQKAFQINVDAVTVGQQQLTVTTAGKNIAHRIGVALRQHNQDNVNTHRIPGMTTANDGSLLAIYDARYDSARDLQGNIDIGLSRSTDGGQTWLPMQTVLDMGSWGGLPEKFNGVSDACILTDKKTGAIFIAGLWMYGVLNKEGKWIDGLTPASTDWNHQWREKGSQPGFEPKQTAQFLIIKSTDNGKSWSKPVNLTKMCKQESWWLWAPAPGAGITMKDGTLVFPTQGRDATGKPFSNITYSKDGGLTWKTSTPAATEQTTENMAVELSDGSLMLNMRANTNRTDTSSHNGRAISTTKDLGQHWTVHPTSHKALQEPTCMASILKHQYTLNGQKKSMLVFCNPDDKSVRKNMTIKVSYDDGKTWQRKILLDEQKSRAYSCLTSLTDGTVGVVYESSQADLVYQVITLKELL